MATNKTTQTDSSVSAYVHAIADEKRRTDVSAIIELFTRETGLPPKMWGPGIVGFGSYHYKYESGHEGDAPITGLASRANAITLYLGCSSEKSQELLAELGKHKAGKGCVYIKRLEDIDTATLARLVTCAVEEKRRVYG